MGILLKRTMSIRYVLLVLLVPLLADAYTPPANGLVATDGAVPTDGLVATRNDPQVRMKISAGANAYSDLGVHWEGDETAGEHYEKLVAVLKPGESVIQNTFHGHSFTLRASDQSFRVRVHIQAPLASDNDERAYRITFNNLNHDGVDGRSAVELKHSKSGYVWINAGNDVTHATDSHKHFTLNNYERNEVVDLMLIPPLEADEL